MLSDQVVHHSSRACGRDCPHGYLILVTHSFIPRNRSVQRPHEEEIIYNSKHSNVGSHDLNRLHTLKHLRHSRHSRPGRRQLPNAIITPIHFRRPNHFNSLSATYQHRALSPTPTLRYSRKPHYRQNFFESKQLTPERERSSCTYKPAPASPRDAKQPP